MTIRILRLSVDDVVLARATFVTMAEVFGETAAPLREAYVAELLGRSSFLAFAAVDGDTPVGGITGHVLPLTRSEGAEVFIYDLAVRSEYQRRGIGRELVRALREEAERTGIGIAFVPADAEDEHALEFYRAIGGEPQAVTIFTFGDSSE